MAEKLASLRKKGGGNKIVVLNDVELTYNVPYTITTDNCCLFTSYRTVEANNEKYVLLVENGVVKQNGYNSGNCSLTYSNGVVTVTRETSGRAYKLYGMYEEK